MGGQNRLSRYRPHLCTIGAVGKDEWLEKTDELVEHEPWRVVYRDENWPGRAERLAELNARPGYDLHERAFVANGAHVIAQRLRLGELSLIASGCLVRGDVAFGDNCTLNAGAITMGKVTIGNDVRIASGAVLVGFNHVFEDNEKPIWHQGSTSEGLVIEDDVWIGTNVTILDGVTVGAHSVIAAGAVVAKDIPPWSIVGGVPARVIRSRLDPKGLPSDPLASFSAAVKAQWPDVLARCRSAHETGESYVDVPGAEWVPRAQNDAIEVAAAFGEVAPGADREEWVERLRAQQDPDTGMFVDPAIGVGDDPVAFDLAHTWRMYNLLSTGYALEVLGSGPAHPVLVIANTSDDDLRARLEALDMGWLAWASGAWIDGWGTGIHLNRRHHGFEDDGALLWGWLLANQHAHTGMWGTYLEPAGDMNQRWRMAVNGFYRLTRGTYAQFGIPVPNPEAAIDTVLAHCRDYGWFATEGRDACNVLDVVHPLWLLGRQTDYRASEIRLAIAGILPGILDDWVDGEGFAFEAGGVPGLQGTEMWLSIVYLAADILGESEGLTWEPRGVHRLEPASRISR